MGNCFCCHDQEDIDVNITSIYDVEMKDIDGQQVNFKQYQSKVLLIFNISCPKLDQLAMIDAEYRSRGLDILAFPFGPIEKDFPTNADLKDYALTRGVSFKIFDKVEINGDSACELFKFLRKNSLVDSRKITNAFCKFVVDRTGRVSAYYDNSVNLPILIKEIESLL